MTALPRSTTDPAGDALDRGGEPAPARRRRRREVAPSNLLVGLVKLARPKQWAKNVLV